MIKKINLIKKVEVLNEIIERAIELPIRKSKFIVIHGKSNAIYQKLFY